MDDYLSNLARAKNKRTPPRANNAIESAGLKSDKIDLATIASVLVGKGYFDREFYSSCNPDVIAAGLDPFEHFFKYGFKEGKAPNAIFDPLWYLDQYTQVKQSDINPLLHYAIIGESANFQPCALFDTQWYRAAYKIPDNESPLIHYINNYTGRVSPIPDFDAVFYFSSYPDIEAAGVNAFQHYYHYGYKEGRNPSKEFNSLYYCRRYLRDQPSVNPLIHYIENRAKPGFFPSPTDDDQTAAALVKRFSKAGPDFSEFVGVPGTAKKRAMVLAYYLTQFHTFPENDRWWGTGFTEWTNIARAQPRFHDHYQPRIPRDLGFYCLDDLDVIRKQVTMALAAGIGGFVYYYYWFNGKRLLEKPLEQFLKAQDINMPFCLMWANESWTRRWDGLEGEVLISQDYRAGDDEALCADFARHFQDPRYIRLEGRPLLMIYRPSLIPDTSEAIMRWRQLFQSNHNENPIILMSQSFNDFDPTKYGLDGAIEFPPHKLTQHMSNINQTVEYIDDAFSGNIYSYDQVVTESLSEATPSFPLIKTAVPSWDNDARRQGTGLVIQGSTPKKYEQWLSELVDKANHTPFFGQPVVCINAWNEWCEGAYLEPDLHFGSAYLNATARAITGNRGDVPKLLLVGHDAFPSGAQHLLLNIGQTLKSSFGLEIEFLLLGDGALKSAYQEVAHVTLLQNHSQMETAVRDLKRRGFSAAIVNTSASGDTIPVFAKHCIRSVFLVHELPRILKEKSLEASARAGISSADRVVFPARFVLDKVLGALSLPIAEKVIVRPQGSYKRLAQDKRKASHIRNELGLSNDALLVLGVGYADLRKGFDLFLQTWRQMRGRGYPVHFCWIGGIDPGLKDWLSIEIEDAIGTGTFYMPGYRADADAFFAAADAFALTSREDPFPTVALEALSIGVPVVAFEGSGGIADFLTEEKLGYVVPFGDVRQMADALVKAFNDRPDIEESYRAQERIRTKFDFDAYVRDLLKMAMPDLPRISVVVPNFNYAHCMADRLGSIFDQAHPIHEIIVLDDASTDNSVEVIESVANERQRDLTLIINDENSGSVFRQWARGAEAATGDYVWIAEADDLADPQFLSSLVRLMHSDPKIELAFSDSRSIDADGAPVFASYKPYFSSIEPGALSRDEVFQGAAFAKRYLSVKNTILNVSSVLWRRDALTRTLQTCEKELSEFRMAGDWRIYLECLTNPAAMVAYVAEPLNVHRRHAQSVTHSLKAEKHVDEIMAIHRIVRAALKIPKKIVDAQTAYASEVRDQLLRTSSSDKVPS